MSGIDDVLSAVRQHGPHVEGYAELGDIKATLHPNGELLIFNYTQFAQYHGGWNPAERVSRGLIIHWPTATVRARAFDKFFNLGQKPEVEYQNLPTGSMEVTAKMDGSLGVLYHDGAQWAIATRGSFIGEQAQWATQHLHRRYDVTRLVPGVTLLFEILYPENRIVIDYGMREDLVLIGARAVDGTDLGYADLTQLATTHGFPLVPSVPIDSLAELAELAASRSGEEGWVVRFDNGLRVKIKTAEYVRLHRLVTGVTARSIWELLMNGHPIDALLEHVPDEFYAWVQTTMRGLQEHYAAIEQTARADMESVKDLPTRRDQAEVLKRTTYSNIAFRMLDAKSYSDQIWKLLYPAATKSFRNDEG